MNNAYAMHDPDFTMLVIGVKDRGAVLYPDKNDADCLKLVFERLKTKSDDARIEFYRMLLDGRPVRGPDGILAQLVEPRSLSSLPRHRNDRRLQDIGPNEYFTALVSAQSLPSPPSPSQELPFGFGAGQANASAPSALSSLPANPHKTASE